MTQRISRIKWMSGGALVIFVSSFLLFLWKPSSPSSAETTNTPTQNDPRNIPPPSRHRRRIPSNGILNALCSKAPFLSTRH